MTATLSLQQHILIEVDDLSLPAALRAMALVLEDENVDPVDVLDLTASFDTHGDIGWTLTAYVVPDGRRPLAALLDGVTDGNTHPEQRM